MANGSVVVHDMDSLEKFGMELAARSAELESLYNALTVTWNLPVEERVAGIVPPAGGR